MWYHSLLIAFANMKTHTRAHTHTHTCTVFLYRLGLISVALMTCFCYCKQLNSKTYFTIINLGSDVCICSNVLRLAGVTPCKNSLERASNKVCGCKTVFIANYITSLHDYHYKDPC